MNKNLVASYYAPLRPYVNKLCRFLWDWIPDLLVIFVSVAILMAIWEFFFFN